MANPIVRTVAVFQYLRGVLDAIIDQKDIDAVGLRIGELLDESLVVDRSEIVHEHKASICESRNPGKPGI